MHIAILVISYKLWHVHIAYGVDDLHYFQVFEWCHDCEVVIRRRTLCRQTFCRLSFRSHYSLIPHLRRVSFTSHCKKTMSLTSQVIVTSRYDVFQTRA